MTHFEENTTRRKRRRTRRSWQCSSSGIAVFFCWFLLIFIHQLRVASAENNVDHSRWSPPRKAGFSISVSYHAASRSASHMLNRNENGTDNLYEDDKRLVRTGPNPLHNK